jgi:hypothetical protein
MPRITQLLIAAWRRRLACALVLLGLGAVLYWNDLPHAFDVMTGPPTFSKLGPPGLAVAFTVGAIFYAAHKYARSSDAVGRIKRLKRKLRAKNGKT